MKADIKPPEVDPVAEAEGAGRKIARKHAAIQRPPLAIFRQTTHGEIGVRAGFLRVILKHPETQRPPIVSRKIGPPGTIQIAHPLPMNARGHSCRPPCAQREFTVSDEVSPAPARSVQHELRHRLIARAA